ncbi:hypothetical protein [Streptomyces sp. NPDC058861]|uniref:hypothetical protein n=1 Tax=Streptomyces sp. NPDC058861 TaxID=3346653 RepID=UPI0036CA81DA
MGASRIVPTLPIGHWSRNGATLSTTASRPGVDGDQAAVDALARPASGADYHRAVQRVHEEHARDDRAWADDTAKHFEPATP